MSPFFRVEPTEDGDYRLCFDNSFSKLSEKMVFFEVIINGQRDGGRDQDEWAGMSDTESMVDYKLDDIRVRRKNKDVNLNDLMSFFLHLFVSSCLPLFSFFSR